MNVLNISKDNAPALYIMAYFDEFVSRKDGALKSFFMKFRVWHLNMTRFKN